MVIWPNLIAMIGIPMSDPKTVVTVEIEHIHKAGCDVAGLAETSAGFS